MILLAQNIYWYKNHYSRQVNKTYFKMYPKYHILYFFFSFSKIFLFKCKSTEYYHKSSAFHYVILNPDIFGRSATVCFDAPKLMSKRNTCKCYRPNSPAPLTDDWKVMDNSSVNFHDVFFFIFCQIIAKNEEKLVMEIYG